MSTFWGSGHGSTQTYKYDGLNRQVSRNTGSLLYNIYDGWDLIGEYNPSATAPLNAYLLWRRRPGETDDAIQQLILLLPGCQR